MEEVGVRPDQPVVVHVDLPREAGVERLEPVAPTGLETRVALAAPRDREGRNLHVRDRNDLGLPVSQRQASDRQRVR